MHRAIVWFRSDLRIHDNPALVRACSHADEVVAVFVACPDQWRAHDWGDPRAAFLAGCLKDLGRSLRSLNIPLRFRSVPRFEDSVDRIHELARELDAGAVFANRELELNEARRDELARETLARDGIAFRLIDDQTLLSPGTVRTRSDTPYAVFTPFKRRWQAMAGERLADGDDSFLSPLPPPRARPGPPVASDPFPDIFDGFERWRPASGGWTPGETAAIEALDAFVSGPIHEYHEQRDIPGVDGTSRLSPWLASGAISARQCFARAVDAAGGTSILQGLGLAPGPGTWINELLWREFNRHLIHAFPRLCMRRPFRPATEHILWSDDEALFDAWRTGQTGVPVIDGAMRQLHQEGWMHNRLRMIVAMFLTKNLLIDWRRGERYFMRSLVDADLANNNAGWQWSASTGTDAAPYFRIFNPISQGRRFDPSGAFVRRYLLQLASIDDASIHDPSPLLRAAAGYPEPIVDLRASRTRAIETFRVALAS